MITSSDSAFSASRRPSIASSSLPCSAITLRTTVERAIIDAAPEISIIDVEEPSEQSISIPVLLGAKPAAVFDPASGCGAAFASDVSVP